MCRIQIARCYRNTASELLSEFEQVQDLGCLVRMGRGQENKKGQKELDKLEAILDSTMTAA